LISVERIGWPDKFVEHGSSIDILREAYDLSPDAIRARILKRWSQTEKPVIAEA
jgi:1-deoxy-D-xylulose-5-phosphate synthase